MKHADCTGCGLPVLELEGQFRLSERWSLRSVFTKQWSTNTVWKIFVAGANGSQVRITAIDDTMVAADRHVHQLRPTDFVAAAGHFAGHARVELLLADCYVRRDRVALLAGHSFAEWDVARADQVVTLPAGLDVFPTEPLPKDHALLSAPNVLMSPHSAFASTEAVARCNKLSPNSM